MLNFIFSVLGSWRACRNGFMLAPLCIALQAGAAGPLPAPCRHTMSTRIKYRCPGCHPAPSWRCNCTSPIRPRSRLAQASSPAAHITARKATCLQPPDHAAATSSSKPATATLVSITNSWAGSGSIDATANLAGSKVYLYSGTRYSVVRQRVVNETKNYYKHFVNSANIFYKNNLASEHAMVTDYYGNTCKVKGSPYIDNCNFDLAGDILKCLLF